MSPTPPPLPSSTNTTTTTSKPAEACLAVSSGIDTTTTPLYPLIDEPVFNKPHLLLPHPRSRPPSLPTKAPPRRPDTASPPPPRGQTDKRRTNDTLHAGFCAWPVVAPRALQRDTERLGRTKVSGIDSAWRDSFFSLLPAAHTARVPSPSCNPWPHRPRRLALVPRTASDRLAFITTQSLQRADRQSPRARPSYSPPGTWSDSRLPPPPETLAAGAAAWP